MIKLNFLDNESKVEPAKEKNVLLLSPERKDKFINNRLVRNSTIVKDNKKDMLQNNPSEYFLP